jgi:glucosamine--fructose-6-phosphate aminotransferase (isomerizing)
MCGIVAYMGNREAYPIVIDGLRRLEYRGYDSTGVAILNGGIQIFKKKGKVQDLVDHVGDRKLSGTLGIGHTRWATHGKPDDLNAHPHDSGNERLALVHNGIIENYASLKEALSKLGHCFKTETDTEVLVHLIEEYQTRDQIVLEDAVRMAMNKVIGAYALVVIDREDPNKIVAARKSSPLVLGIGDNEFFFASDASPLISHTNKVVYLKDEELAVIHRDGTFSIKNIQNIPQKPEIKELDLKLEELEKGGYEHFMLKEVHQQAQTVEDCMRGRLNPLEGFVGLGGLGEYAERFANANRLIIVGCGTSWHSGLIGEYLIEDLAHLSVEVEYASEFRYRNPVIYDTDIVLAISQSGETADTLAALKYAREKGALLYGIVNSVGSSISRLTDAGSYIHAGPEIGVASTKAFTGQVTLLALLALTLAEKRGTLSRSELLRLMTELKDIPRKIELVLKQEQAIRYIAEEIKDNNNALYLGRGYNFPVALEGALKMKEISYIHAEGYPAAEMKHGPIALIDENMPVIVIATNESAYEKIVSNVQEVKARKGRVIAIVQEGEKAIRSIADYSIEIPRTAEPFTPLLSVIPLQLLSYHVAVLRGCNVDQPRNLAKSVTVE